MANETQGVFTLSDVRDATLNLTWVAQGWSFGWVGCGDNTPGTYRSDFDRIAFSSDLVTASARGNSAQNGHFRGNGVGNNLDGWSAGGVLQSSPGFTSSTSRMIFATDSATGVAKGALTTNKANPMTTTDNSNGYWGGSYTPSQLSTIDKLIFATDTAAAVAKGPLSAARYQMHGGGDRSTVGYSVGGSLGSVLSTVDKIIFASDTATAVAKGSLTTIKCYNGVVSKSTDLWTNGSSTVCTVDRIIFASDTATAVAKGSMVVHVQQAAGSDNFSTDGWWGGGSDIPGAKLSSVQRLIFSTDTATMTSRGVLNTQRRDSIGF